MKAKSIPSGNSRRHIVRGEKIVGGHLEQSGLRIGEFLANEGRVDADRGAGSARLKVAPVSTPISKIGMRVASPCGGGRRNSHHARQQYCCIARLQSQLSADVDRARLLAAAGDRDHLFIGRFDVAGIAADVENRRRFSVLRKAPLEAGEAFRLGRKRIGERLVFLEARRDELRQPDIAQQAAGDPRLQAPAGARDDRQARPQCVARGAVRVPGKCVEEEIGSAQAREILRPRNAVGEDEPRRIDAARFRLALQIALRFRRALHQPQDAFGHALQEPHPDVEYVRRDFYVAVEAAEHEASFRQAAFARARAPARRRSPRRSADSIRATGRCAPCRTSCASSGSTKRSAST